MQFKMEMMGAKKTVDYAKEVYKNGELPYLSKAEKVRLSKIVVFSGSNNKILDIGCYNGTIGELLIKKNNDVYAIEANQDAAQLAIRKDIKVTIQDIESKFDFENNFFDTVVAAEIIEHILDTDFFIDEIKRILKPKGVLVLSTPNAASLGRRLFLLVGKNPYFEASFGYPSYAHAGHIRFFTKDLRSSAMYPRNWMDY
jgi:2-polyprenyl-3-methyl-5-hydroxy-6-metoxy-1,4-benzoquinol methylase